MDRHRVADAASMKILAGVVKRWHPTLHKEKVAFSLIFVDPPTNNDGQITGTALKVAGSPVAGKCSLVSGKWYAMTEEDVVIEVAANVWNRLTGPQREALLDHEVSHVKCSVDKNGLTKRREQGQRPFLETIPDDYMVTGFYHVAERHKCNSLEWASLLAIKTNERAPQLLFEFPEEQVEAQAVGETKTVPDPKGKSGGTQVDRMNKALATRPGRKASKKKTAVA